MRDQLNYLYYLIRLIYHKISYRFPCILQKNVICMRTKPKRIIEKREPA